MPHRRSNAPAVETLGARLVPATVNWAPPFFMRNVFGSINLYGTANADRITVNDVAGTANTIRVTVRDANMTILSSQTYGTVVLIPTSISGIPLTMSRTITVNGLGGDDRITNVSTFGLVMAGGVGNDTLRGGAAGETMYGGDNNDEMLGGGGFDIMYGEGGNDTMYGCFTQAEADDGAGDFMDGGAGGDLVWGGGGNDTLRGGAEDDRLWGADGHDAIDGGAGKDTAQGGLGDDLLYGGLDGSDDDLWGGSEGDTFTTPNGVDTFYYEYATQFNKDNLKDWNPQADRAFQNEKPPGL